MAACGTADFANTEVPSSFLKPLKCFASQGPPLWHDRRLLLAERRASWGDLGKRPCLDTISCDGNKVWDLPLLDRQGQGQVPLCAASKANTPSLDC